MYIYIIYIDAIQDTSKQKYKFTDNAKLPNKSCLDIIFEKAEHNTGSKLVIRDTKEYNDMSIFHFKLHEGTLAILVMWWVYFTTWIAKPTLSFRRRLVTTGGVSTSYRNLWYVIAYPCSNSI